MYRKFRKLIVWCLVACMVLTQAYITSFAADGITGHKRLWGKDRYKTAVAISKSGWNSSHYAVLARGDDYADALCAGPLAKKYGAPILLTSTNELNSDTKAELKRLGVEKVFIIGGYAAISKKVENALDKEDIEFERIYGAGRYETSVKIAEKLGDVKKAALATGMDFPDALSISVVAAKLGMPILLTQKNNLPDDVEEYIDEKDINEIYIIGGQGVISKRVENLLPRAVRLGGNDRYETNTRVMKYFEDELNFANIYAAIGGGPKGNEFADALAGAVLAAKTSSPLVLTGKYLPKVTENYLKSRVVLGSRVTALGGKTVVPDAVIDSIAALVDKVEVKKNYNKAGTYGPESGTQTISGNVVISAKGVTLRNTVIKGDLLLAETIGNGDVTLKNVTVEGTTIVRGGGPNSVIMYNFNGKTVTVDVPDGSSVRLVAQGNTSVESVEMFSDGKLEEDGVAGEGFTEIVIPAGAEVVLSGDFDTVVVEAAGANVSIENGRVNTLNVAESASNAEINIRSSASVSTLEANAPVEVKGNGTITTANINSNGVSIEQKPANTNVAKGVEEANVGGEKVKGGETSAPSSGGGGGGGSSTIAVDAISVEPTELILDVGQEGNITAIISPSNATNKKVTWSSSDTSIATVDENGKVIAVTAGTATITATSNNGKTATTTVIVLAENTVALVGTEQYISLASAVEAANEGDTIKLVDNVTLSDTVLINNGKNITIDLNTHTVTAPNSDAFEITNGTLTVNNGFVEATGDNSSTPLDAFYVDGTTNNAKLVIGADANVSSQSGNCVTILGENAVLETSGYMDAYGVYSAIQGNGTEAYWGTTIIVNGGRIRSHSEYSAPGIYHPQVGTLIVNGGEIIGGTGIEIRAGELTVNGGIIRSDWDGDFYKAPNGSGSTIDGVGIAVSQHTTNQPVKVTINDGTVSSAKYEALYEEDLQDEEATGNIEIVVKGGNFDGGIYSENCTGFITGGTFNTDPSAYCAEGYEAIDDNGTWVVSKKQVLMLNANSTENEPLDLAPIDVVIQAAIAAKEGISVSVDGMNVPAGTYWVKQEDMDALDAAIAAAEAAKETAKTQQDVADAVGELETAISTFNNAKQEAIEAIIDVEKLKGTEDAVKEDE